MSKLSFRSRQLDVNKPIFIYRHEDYSKISEFAHGSRPVAPIPSGMEKEEESEFHIQQAIQNQKVTVKGIVIPTPSVETGDDYNLFYKGNFPLPKQLIHIQPFDLEENFPEYDLDTEDEEWLKQKKEHQNLDINPVVFENIINHLEKGSGQHMLTLAEAKLLMKDHPVYMDIIYDYWTKKRQRNGHNTLMPQVLTDKKAISNSSGPIPTGPSANNANNDTQLSSNPYIAFRRRAEKMQTRKNRKNDEYSYEKMLKLKRELSRAMGLFKMIKKREALKCDLIEIVMNTFRSRYELQDFSGECWKEIKSSIQATSTTRSPAKAGGHHYPSLYSSRHYTSPFKDQYEWGHDLKKRRISTSPLKRKRLWSSGQPEPPEPNSSAAPASHRSRRQQALDQQTLLTTTEAGGLLVKKQRHHALGSTNNSSSSYYYYYMDETSSFYDPTLSGRSGNRRLKRLQSQQQTLHQSKGLERASDSPPPIMSRVKAIRQLKRIIDAKALANSTTTNVSPTAGAVSSSLNLATSQSINDHNKNFEELATMDLDGEFAFKPLPGCRYVLPLPLKPAWELLYYDDSPTTLYSPIKTSATISTILQQSPTDGLQCNSVELKSGPDDPEILSCWKRCILPLPPIPLYTNEPNHSSTLVFAQPWQRLRKGRSLRTFIDQRLDHDHLSTTPTNSSELVDPTRSSVGSNSFEFDTELPQTPKTSNQPPQKPSLLQKLPSSIKTDAVRLIYKNTRITPLSYAMNRIRKQLPKMRDFPTPHEESMLSPSDPIARLVKRSITSTSPHNVMGSDKNANATLNVSVTKLSYNNHKVLLAPTSNGGSHISLTSSSISSSTSSSYCCLPTTSFADHANYVLKQMIAPGQNDRLATMATAPVKCKAYETSSFLASTPGALIPPALQTNLISLINHNNTFVTPSYYQQSAGNSLHTTSLPAGTKMLTQTSSAAGAGLQHFYILKQPSRTLAPQPQPQAIYNASGGLLSFPISHIGGLSSASAVTTNTPSNSVTQNYIYKSIVPGSGTSLSSGAIGGIGSSNATTIGGTIIRISGSDVLYNYGTNRISILPQPSSTSGASQNFFFNNPTNQHLLLNVTNDTPNNPLSSQHYTPLQATIGSSGGNLKVTPSLTLRNAINSSQTLTNPNNNLASATSLLNRVMVTNPPFPLQNLALVTKPNTSGLRGVKAPAGVEPPPLDNLSFTTNTLKTLPSLVGLTGQSVPYQQNYRLLAQQPSAPGKLQQGSSPFNTFKIMATTDVAGGGSSYIVFNNPKALSSEPGGQVKYITNFKGSENALEVVSNSTYLDTGTHPPLTTPSAHSQAALGAGQTLLLLSPQQHPKRISSNATGHQALNFSGFVNNNRTGIGVSCTPQLYAESIAKTFESSPALATQPLNLNGLFLPSQQNQRLKTLSLLLPNGQLIHNVGTAGGLSLQQPQNSDVADQQLIQTSSFPQSSINDSSSQPFKNLVLTSMPKDKMAASRPANLNRTSHLPPHTENRTHSLMSAPSQINPSILNGLLEQSAKSHSSNAASSLLAYQASQPKFKLNDDAPSLNKLTNKNLLTSLIFTNNMRLNNVASPCPPINGSNAFPKTQLVSSNAMSLSLPLDNILPLTSIDTTNQQQSVPSGCVVPLPCIVDGGLASATNKTPLASVLSNPATSSSPSFSPTIVNLFAIT